MYLVSDTHFAHANIIEYCDRPFESEAHMNDHMLTEWNETIGPDDKVLFLGDLAMANDKESQKWFAQLNGDKIFLEGNHDSENGEALPLPVHDTFKFDYSKYSFFCTHYPPEETPEDFDGWTLHGHTHNNEMDTYPFINPENKTVNLSVELIGYTPIHIDELIEYIEAGERLETRPNSIGHVQEDE